MKSSLLPGASLPTSSSACRAGGPSLCFLSSGGRIQKKMMDFSECFPSLGKERGSLYIVTGIRQGLVVLFFFNYICMPLADNTFRYLYIYISSNCIFLSVPIRTQHSLFLKPGGAARGILSFLVFVFQKPEQGRKGERSWPGRREIPQ